ncbi:MAG TPA: hypothetical protein VNU93_03150, partial [Verrucomicrobiae bacterium]|nr:hypothetical protein [Verrucomicrobiae bacterium]
MLEWEISPADMNTVTYEVYRTGSRIHSTTEKRYADEGLAPNKTYAYFVRALDSDGNITVSDPINVTTDPDTLAPSNPVNLRATLISDTTVTFTWDLSIDNVGVVAYDVYRDGTKLGRVRGATYKDSLLTPGTSYVYTVRAFDAASNYSGDSISVTATTNQPVMYTAVVSGMGHTLALRSDGTVWAWGNNDNGQLGNGSTINSSLPVVIKGLDGVVALAGGGLHSLALKNDGTVWAWGSNWYGQLGNGTNTNNVAPIQVQGLSNVKYIAAGYYHSLAVKDDGTVWAWGRNWDGQLGNGYSGSGSDRSTPVQVTGLTGIVKVTAGLGHSMALRNDRTIWAWGYGYQGQLGNGNSGYYASTNTPVQVSGITTAISIEAYDDSSFAVKADGTAWGWGSNDKGQLGNNSVTSTSLPTQVVGLTGVISIEASDYHGVALTNDGKVWAWGDNSYGQLGDGTTNRSLIAKEISGISGITAVASDAALKNNG